LQIDPCVPRWWRDFEITYRRNGTTYRIKVENPLAISRGVATVELDGALQSGDDVPLVQDGQTHVVRVVLGEKTKIDSGEEESEPAHEQQASGS